MPFDEENAVPRVWNWLKDTPPCEKALLWFHTTSAIQFREMTEVGECKIRPCEVFAEDLLYFFYGRPAYRLGDEPMSKAASQPVVLLFEPPLAEAGRRLYPFDTGAFHANRLERWMNPAMKMPSFALKCGSEGALRFVSAFFESNDNYLRTRVRPDMAEFGGDFEVSALYMLFAAAADCNPEQPADDRRMAVELQLNKSISLASNALIGVIYPDELEQSPWFKSFRASRSSSLLWEKYQPQHSKRASAYQGLLEDRARRIQEEMGLV